MSKITIIGTGNVGATIAYSLTMESLASEIVLIDINQTKAEGEAMDISQSAPFNTPLNLYAGDYEDAADSDIVILTSGVARKAGQSRLELASINVGIVRDIAPKITRYAPRAIYIIVSNPVDILTYAFIKFSGLPEKQVIGSGTMLDTARLREIVAKKMDVSARNIHAYVFGEHGDSSVFPWSVTSVIGMDFYKYCRCILNKNDEEINTFLDEVEKDVRTAGGEVIKRKGATFFAVSACVTTIARCILSANNSVLTVSNKVNGRYGIKEDVCLSLPYTLGPQGIVSEINPPLLPEELENLHASARLLRQTMDGVDLLK